MKRAERRAHKERMKKKARQVYPFSLNPEILADHLQNCSKVCCGNPRHFAKGKEALTIQERKAQELEKEQVENIYEE